MLDLAAICKEKQDGLNSVTDSDIIKSLANYENTVNEGYQGRLLFELIQNARDAAYKADINSRIIICIQGDTVYVGNTGMPFDEGGITAMTRLGVSDKSDNKTIGHKGIGFKAIQEYSITPKIITRFGTIYFDKTKLNEILSGKFPNKFPKLVSVPLFYYPHYNEACIKDTGIEMLEECETVIAFQLNKDKTSADFVNKFNEISNEELILLQNIESISLYRDNILEKTTAFSYHGNQITVNDNEAFEIIDFPEPVFIPNELYAKLSEKEQELFQEDRVIDIKIVFRLNENGLPVSEPGSNLYLFYPLEMESGFPYKIHSYFSCNPQRTSITQSHLNDFIFEKITELQISHVLPYLKAKGKKEELLQFVSFCKVEDKKLQTLYNNYTEKLKAQQFIWIEQENGYYNPDQIMLCNSEVYTLLRQYKIDGKTLFVTNEATAKWLTDNFNVSELDFNIFHAHIEVIAESEKDNTAFFQQLYQYIAKECYTLNDKNILLGEDGRLYSGANKVFMRGERIEIHIPKSIRSKITLLHPDINMGELSQNDLKQLGIIQFSREEIADRALDLFKDEEVNNSDIIIFLLHFQTDSQRTLNNIRSKVLVPVGEYKVKWISPLYNPVYIEDENLRVLYPNGNFINYSVIEHEDRETLNTLFLNLNVWNIPALYYISKNVVNNNTSQRHINALNKYSRFNSSYYTVNNDRKLDFPEHINTFFYDSIKDNWSRYRVLIEDKEFMPFSVISSGAYHPDKNIDPRTITTTFGHQLRENRWIKINENFYSRSEVIGIDRATHIREKHIKQDSFNWLILDYKENQSFFNNLAILHINSNSVDHIIAILRFIQEKYADMENQPSNPDYKRFYHTILKYLYLIYEIRAQGELIDKLKQIPLLCTYHKGGTEYFSWQLPRDILHVDDTKLYQSLSDKEKEILGFFFTKSDKNEIGKIFNLIAPKLSSRIKEEVIHSDTYQSEKLLYPEIKNLIYIILLVEDKTENNLKDDMLEKLLQVKIRTVSTIVRQISIIGKNDKGKKPEKENLSYYFDVNENNLYISSENAGLPKELFTEIVNEIFSIITQKDIDLGLHIRYLMQEIQSKNFQDVRKSIDYDKNRWEELKDILDDNNFNEEQILWDAIIKCKCPQKTISPFNGFGQTDWNTLADILSVDPELLNQWHTSFNYVQYNAEQNLHIVQEMVNILELKDQYMFLNDLLSGRLNFEIIYNERYDQYKNKYADTLKYNVYETLLAAKDSKIQTTFKEFIDTVDNINPELSVPILFFDAKTDLLTKVEKIVQDFDYPPITGLETKRNSEWQRIKEYTTKQFVHFNRSIAKEKVNPGYTTEFITKNEHYSLLYFHKVKELVGKYIEEYPLVEEIAEENSPVSDTLKSFRLYIEEDDKEIVSVAVKNLQVGNTLDDLHEQIIPKSKASGGGYKNPMLVNSAAVEDTGKAGEWLMFTKLSKLFDGRVTWVSEYAKEYGYIPDKFAVGYDMYYIDSDNKKHYVEVKTSKGNDPEFHITINEIRAAMSYSYNYHIMWITDVFDKDNRQYADLGNIFINFGEDEGFFNNSRFKPILTAFKIAFNPEIKETVYQLIEDKEYETA